MTCTLCPLHQTAITICLDGIGTGDTLIVGAQPGVEEDTRGEVFIGPSGDLLKEMLADAGYKLDDVRLTNAVRCKTPKVNKSQRSPFHEEIDACRAHLKAEIHTRKPKLIIALGDIALQSLCKISGIKGKRGSSFPLHPDFEYECEVWATYHSAYVQRIQPVRSTVVADLRKIRDSGLEREAVDWEWWGGSP